MFTLAMILGIPLLCVAYICLVIWMLYGLHQVFGVNPCKRCGRPLYGQPHTCPPEIGADS